MAVDFEQDQELEQTLLEQFKARPVRSARLGIWWVQKSDKPKLWLCYAGRRRNWRPLGAPKEIVFGTRARFETKREAMFACMMNSGEYEWLVV